MRRRAFLKVGASAALGASIRMKSSAGVSDDEIFSFMQNYSIPGLSLAYGREDQIIYARAFGYEDIEAKRLVRRESRFRIASCSKPITSAAVFRLVQNGLLHVDQNIFGINGILNHFSTELHPERLALLKVRHLLTHTSGGWGNEDNDPMFWPHRQNRTKFLQEVLNTMPLNYAPGTAFAYSNFGYFLLGRLIEKVSGQSYESYVREQVLAPLGLNEIRLSKEKPVGDEVHYYSRGEGDPYQIPIHLHDASGGWCSSAIDLVRFTRGVFSSEDQGHGLFRADILASIIQTSSVNPRYANGWSVSPESNCFHSGGFSGTASFLMHRKDGLMWSVLTNSRLSGSEMEEDLHRMSWSIARSLPR